MAKIFGMFQGITIKQFQQTFSNEQDCKQYLFDLKWKDGYRCRRCSGTSQLKGRTAFHMRCGNCGYSLTY